MIEFMVSKFSNLRIKLRFTIIFLSSIFLLSCNEVSLDENLENGLNNYRKSRAINHSIIDGYELKKWAFIKEDSINYKFIFQLNEDIDSDTVAKYGLGLVYFADKKYLPDNKEYLIALTQPNLISKGNYKYIIETVKPPTRKLDSIHVFLTGRNQYTEVIGNMIRLKNVQL